MVHQLILSCSLLLLLFHSFSTLTPVSRVGSDTVKTPDGTTIAMPVMARKAGGSWKPELVQTQGEMRGKHDETREEDNEYSYNDEEEEPQCPKNMFYHIRGKRCVPLRCIGGGGNWKRNPETGECPVTQPFYRSYYSPRSYWYKTSVYQSPRYSKIHYLTKIIIG